ncbi:DUF7619 domain-containing protein [Winogradskyella pulchriflava]|uniref:Choice-of-anchor L domain-containing protein n=1 Tax=Winogradskyella pulchriflava TaxID=1110688 RepID=A0ABV6QAW2_9FLAO
MNQKLLNAFFILFTVLASFAQVANGPQVLEVCDDGNNDGFSQFDLSVLNQQILGSQSPNDFDISYFESQTNAVADVNPLPVNYSNTTNPQTIFARVTDINSGDYAITEVTLIVNVSHEVDLGDFSICPGSSVILDTNLDSTSYSFIWYLDGFFISEEDQPSIIVNQPGIYQVQVFNVVTGCLTEDTSIVSDGAPTLTTPTPLFVCDEDMDGFALFDLTTKDAEILNGQVDMIITYHETQSDADNGVNALVSPYTNSAQFSQTIFARVENTAGDCFSTINFDIVAENCPANPNVVVDDTTYTVNELVEDVLLAGQCSQVFNITYSTGTNFGTLQPNGIGYFSNSGNDFPFTEGIVLSNGSASDAAGPNDSNHSSGSNQWPGDVDLEATTGIQSTNNATLIEFDFVPVVNEINFEFIMASEEYDGSNFECTFSDAFAFLLTDAQGNTTNLAVLPGTQTPILVTNVHPQNDSCAAVNETYFGGYIPENAPPIGYNGMTTVFTAQAPVVIGDSYHIKLVIADALDSAFDSAVFLKAGSFDVGELCNDIGLINVKAFNDTNSNGLLDAGETDFTNGYFTYEKNNDGVINEVNTSIGNFSVVSTDENDTYSISFNVYDEYSSCYTQTISSFDAVSVMNGDIITLEFPITDNLVCEDLAVYLLSAAGSPRPGFDYENQIVIENMGSTTIASGTVEFTYDELLTFNSVTGLNPNYTVTATTNGFTIDFVNLAPGESEVADVSLHCPASVNLGELITNTVNYTTDTNDLFASNNTSSVAEVVIGSYDPNDKMESHGPEIVYDDFITSDEYLYYTIRFQNVGTAEAIFVRIEDELDTMLDETTFQMLRSSHDYQVTRTGTSLEWYFENIDLPAEQDDEEGSHGFVYFKIKPKPGYLVGDVIPNSAAIYFDFNAPIITNTFNTTFIEPLSVDTFESNGFTMHPNPATDNVVIALNNVTNANLRIYDVQGKTIIMDAVHTPTAIEFNVASLKSGLYFVEVSANNTSKVQKLIVN